MEITFEFFIPSGSILPGLDFKHEIFEWQGQEYPQGAKKCYIGPRLWLENSPIPDYIQLHLSDRMPHIQWHCIAVKGDALKILREHLKVDRADSGHLEILHLINTILQKVEAWVVNFEIDHDTAGEIVPCSHGDLINRIKSALATRQGFLAASS